MKRQSRALKMAALEEEMAREARAGFSLKRSSVDGVQHTKDVPREVIEVLAPMFSGDAAWPDMPDSETALVAQLCDLLKLVEER